MQTENTPCKSLLLTMVDPVVEVKKSYHSQIFLEECKYKITEEQKKNLINDDFDSSLSDNESDNESDNKSVKI